MTGRKLRLPWGHDDEIELNLPPGWRLRETLIPNRPERLPELREEIERALANPIGQPRLSEFARRGPTACVVVDDRTRPTPVAAMLLPVLRELNAAGVADSGITALVALGTHREMTPAELAARLGPEAMARVRVVNHSMDPPALADLGRTPTDGVHVTLNRLVAQADTVVLIGCIEAHEQAGFGGGYKNLMPGVAGWEPVRGTHNAAFQKPERISSAGMPRSRCRFRRAVDESGALLGPKVFIVNAVLDPVRVMAVVAGDPIAAHEAGTKVYAGMAAVRPSGPADVVIAGSSPLDLDLRVSFKACFNAAAALKPGGLFISVSKAPEGMGDLRMPKRLLPIARPIIRRAPLGLIERTSGRFVPTPDQAAGTISLLKLIKAGRGWLFLTEKMDGLNILTNCGLDFFHDPAALMARAEALMSEAEVVALPRAGASYIAWE